MKRTLSTAGSPPPSTAPKAKKPRAARPRKPTKKAAAAAAAAAAGEAGSPGASGADSPFPVGASSPPAPGQGSAVGSPAPGGGRGRSVSVAVGERAGAGEDGAGAAAQGPGEADEQDEAEDEVFEFSDDEFGSNQREAAKQKEDLRVLLEHFDGDQMDRYEAYRRSGLAKGSVRKLVNQVLGQSVSPSILTVVRGFAKVFVGELVEKARAVDPHPGALTPQDLREAYRLYLEEHEGAGAGGTTNRKKLFVR